MRDNSESAQTAPTTKSSARSAASRANGALSKGPTSAHGKQVSSQNATRHGLLAKAVVLDEEPVDAFHALLTELTEQHAPATPTELMLVETMASARWRLMRIWSMQKAALDSGLIAQELSVGGPAKRAAMA